MRALVVSLFLACSASLSAQMTIAPGDTLYGAEWFEDGMSYLKIPITEQGFYRIDGAVLSLNGWSLNASNQNRWQLWLRGEEVPLHVDDTGIYFFGAPNAGEMDRFLFPNPTTEQLNPDYSIYNDTAAYFLGLAQEQSGITGQRFSTQNNTPTGLPSITEITRRAKQIFGEFPIKEFIRTGDGFSIYYSHYTKAEGFGSRSTNDLLSFNGSTSSPFNLELPNLVNGASAIVSSRFGLAFDNHQQRLVVDGQEIASVQQVGWGIQTLTGTFTPNNNSISGALEGSGGDRDKASLASVTIDYPATTDIDDNFYFTLAAAANDRRLNFNNPVANTTYALFNLNTQRVQFSTTADFSIPASSNDQAFHLVAIESASSVSLNVTTLTLDNPIPEEEVDFLIITSERLRNTTNGSDPVADYANYRRSAAGGSYRVQLVNVETLYNTHAYGVERHPLAIRNYQAALRRAHPELKFLFLVGKGREYRTLRTDEDLNNATPTYFLPSFGFPASDNLISADLDGIVPKLATGRLSVVNTEEVSIYLDKIRGFDQQVNLGQSLEERDWVKQIVHLSGGGLPTEQLTIRNLLGNMAGEIEQNEFGGNVNSFFKTSSDPIEESREQAIFNRINTGTSLVTFFGHSSSQGFDFNIDNPSNYANVDRYPLMFSLGCYSGDAFTSLRSIGERFVLLPQKGAIAFGASKGLGYISVLGVFGRKYYELLGGEMYGRSIGEILNGSISSFQDQGSFTFRILLEQFSLNGDPAIRMHPRPGPDLVFDPTNISFEPRVVPAQQDSFTVNFRLVNLGQGTQDSLMLRLSQQLPNGSVQSLGEYRIQASGYDQTISLNLPNLGFDAIGPNRLLATLDSGNEILELPAPLAENNNELRQGQEAGVPFFVVANTARPAFPPPYALHEGDANVRLTASTTNPLAEEQKYFLQLDTSQLFNNPIANTEVTQSGGLIDWSPQINWQDSITYYWRISPDSINTEGQGFLWNTSSFTYLESNQDPGWAIAHQGQFNAGKITNILTEENQQEWNFARNLNDVRIRNLVYDPNDTPDWIWNGQEFASPWPWVTRHGVQVMILDSIRNRDWIRSDGSGAFGSLPHGGTRSPWSFDTQTPEGRAGLMQFIEEFIPEGKYVTLYTSQRGTDIDYGATEWINDSLTLGKTIFGVLEAEGAEAVRQLSNLGSVPYAFIFQKGIGPLGEAVAEDINSEADITVAIAENWQSGLWQSDLVGPATEWDNYSFSFKNRNVTEADSVQLKLYGLSNINAVPVELNSEWLQLSNGLTYEADLTNVEAMQYPFLRLDLEVFDNLERTAATPQQVYFQYTGTPDIAIDPTVAYSAGLDSLQQGETLDFEIGYRNIALRDMDSLLVRLTINAPGGINRSEVFRQAPVAAGETGSISYSAPTADLTGNVQLQLQLNPEQDQPEQITFNNDLIREYTFGQDDTPPLLQLYFDGVAIRDGDLVSAKPEILLELRDDNPFLLLNDSAAFTINLRYPDGSAEFIANGDERIEFQAATNGEENRARVYLRPELAQDGLYTIGIQAGDRSGNASGRVELLRDFEVITEQRVANVFNYPNPFTDQTQFVYTLTGDVPPEVFRIQIMTVSGRVVYDVDLAQEEALKIGTHRTEFTWDGTDEYGDKLANGVYLYRVITRDSSGQALEQYNNGTDRFFKNRMGKMVILR